MRYWLALKRTPGLGDKTFLTLLEVASPEHILALPFSGLIALGLKQDVIASLQNPDWDAVEADLRWLEHPGHWALTLNNPAYPEQLKEIADPPPILFVKGSAEWLSFPQIAIVGSRNPSSMGIETATAFARSLAEHGFIITSGLALGIDAAGHRGALEAGGHTIAVAGTGPDRVYPARHKDLATEIVHSGAIVSEFLPGTVAKANHFPRRNRIISGLCQGLLVVEAATQSGSLITARLALEQNREVFAIPGSIHNPLARGCNALIREGAKLVETTNDILEELDQYNQKDACASPKMVQTTLDPEQQTLLNLIMYSPTSIDQMVKASGQTVEVVSSMLLMLELQGYIEAAAGGYYMRVR
ncbi:MAG: DNA-processing protein DprA [Gammaproteobacteria bacterium]